MSDDDDRDEHEEHMQKHIKALEASTKRQMDGMMNSLMEAMAPMLMGGQLLSDEAKAWDEYVCAFVRGYNHLPDDDGFPSEADEKVIEFADKMLTERRKRFNREAFAEHMRGMLPSGRGLCDRPIVNDGKDMGHRCSRNAGHQPPCY